MACCKIKMHGLPLKFKNAVFFSGAVQLRKHRGPCHSNAASNDWCSHLMYCTLLKWCHEWDTATLQVWLHHLPQKINLLCGFFDIKFTALNIVLWSPCMLDRKIQDNRHLKLNTKRANREEKKYCTVVCFHMQVHAEQKQCNTTSRKMQSLKWQAVTKWCILLWHIM